MKKIEFQSTSVASLMELIRAELGYSSNNKARELIKSGKVSIDGEFVKFPSTKVNEGQSISVDFELNDQRYVKGGDKLPVDLLFEDEHLLVFEKAAMKPLHSGPKNRGLVAEIRSFYKNRGWEEDIDIVNNLPMSGSGIVMMAKTLKMKRELEEHWRNAKLRYYALVEGKSKLKQGEIKSEIAYNSMGMAYVTKEDGREAVLKYETLNAGEEFSLLRVEPLTHVRNQINAQLAHIKMPIVGDLRDGKKKGKRPLMLHLFSVDMLHPVSGDKLSFKTRVPKDYLSLVKGK